MISLNDDYPFQSINQSMYMDGYKTKIFWIIGLKDQG